MINKVKKFCVWGVIIFVILEMTFIWLHNNPLSITCFFIAVFLWVIYQSIRIFKPNETIINQDRSNIR